jgi:hypothetical protein
MLSSATLQTLRDGAIAAISWGVGYALTKWLTVGTSAAAAYALLVGWWLTAYVSSLARLSLSSVIPLWTVYVALFLGAQVSGKTWFYRDTASLGFLSGISIVIAQSVIVISPILFDTTVRRAFRIWQRTR